jgi:hypothetical protein
VTDCRKKSLKIHCCCHEVTTHTPAHEHSPYVTYTPTSQIPFILDTPLQI